MKFWRIGGFALAIFSFCGGMFVAQSSALQNKDLSAPNAPRFVARGQMLDFRNADLMNSDAEFSRIAKAAAKAETVGIKEVVPAKYQERYKKWKDELLSTEFGRRQWETYAGNKNFNLIIAVSGDKEFAAKTGDYQWNDNGELIGATIILGKNLNQGYPNAIYYPVMNSLSIHVPAQEINGDILAATKFAHELGHVNMAAKTDGRVFQRQNKLVAAYYKIFLKNGYQSDDSRLVELAAELGGTPMQIWTDREYWGEAFAMHFLAERAGREKFYCPVFNQIKRNVSDFAKGYEERFVEISEAKFSAACRN